MSFGGPAVDNYGVVSEFPAQSLCTGLLANALGYNHRQYTLMQRIQARLRYAVRRDRAGRRIVDFQTVDLGQGHLLDEGGWTTRGYVEKRAGASSKGTHIRYRHYLADRVYTVALYLEAPDESPTLKEIEQALRYPARPLFIGRKACLPSVPLLVRTTTATSLRFCLESEPRIGERGDDGPLTAWWPQIDDVDKNDAHTRTMVVTDERDWANQIHVGRRRVIHGTVMPPEAT
jgi:CRISPR system Cascade subunit CasD